MGEGLEDGHKDEAAHTQLEDGTSLAHVQVVFRSFLRILVFRGHQVALELQREDVGRDEHRDERGDEDFGDDTEGGDDPAVPQHDGGHVADRREGTSRVGGNHHERGVDDAVFLVFHEFAQNHHHHNRGG